MRLDLVGQKFDRLEVMKFAGINKFNKTLWECNCICGNKTVVTGSHLMKGNTKSCGCLRKESTSRSFTTHGNRMNGALPKIYRTWQGMKERCYNPSNARYKDYGGRGIKVCDRWLDPNYGFENFYNDMGDPPEGMSLDRKDNNGDYEPENCRWATHREQMNNTRANRRLIFNGEDLTVAQWAVRLSVSREAIMGRKDRGWSDEKIITTPVRACRRISKANKELILCQ